MKTDLSGVGVDGVEILGMWDGTVQHVRYLRGAGESYCIGSNPAADWNVAAAGAGLWPLVHGAADGSFVVAFPEGSDGELVSGPAATPDVRTLADLRATGRAVPAPEGGWFVALPADARCSVNVGAASFVVQRTGAPARLRGSVATDARSHLFNGISLAAHLLVIALMVSIAPDAHSLGLDGFKADSRFAKYILKPAEKPEEKIPSWLAAKKHTLPESGKSAARAKGAAGVAGKPGAKPNDKRMGIKGPPDTRDILIARTRADEALSTAGVLGAFRSIKGGLVTVDGGADRSIGRDEIDALGHLTGRVVGEADGTDGRSLYGGGRGGDGDSDTTIGLDDGGPYTVGTKGPGDGDGIGPGCAKAYGCEAARYEKHSDAKVDPMAMGVPKVRGGLDMETIRRVMRKHTPEMKYCFDRALLADKDTHGKVKVAFVISPSGAVVKAETAESSVGSASFESCLLEKISRIVFPAPDGGGIVEVKYPFVFNAPAATPAPAAK